MSITFETISDDPALFLFALQNEAAHFQPMTRDSFHRSIFLDDRIVRAPGQGFALPFAEVRGQQWPDPASRPIGLIFHVAQCGSTLLARALDLPGRSLVLREPAALRRLGVDAGPEGAVDEAMLRFTLSMLGKRWDANAPVVVKANVPVNFIASEVLSMEPETKAICLYFPLASYVAAVMRTEGHEKWVESIFAEMRLDSSRFALGANPRTTAERTACLWFAQMKLFEALTATYSGVRTLNAELLFGQPSAAVAASAAHFGVVLRDGEAEEIASGELFETYSKNPALDYDPEVRAARDAEAKRRLAPQIAEAEAWVSAASTRHGPVGELGAPLVG
ncbi:MAG: hypothetical protein V4513_10645 [Pseudomonadota bacterium]